MISFTTAELNAWIAAFFFPLTRILGLLALAPPFNNPALPVRARLLLGLAITVAIAPALPAQPSVDPASMFGLLLLAQEMMIGLAMGFCLRLVFTAIDMAGNLVSMQMGLGFATAYDPQSASQTVVVSEFLGMLALLLFMAGNGHLMVIAALVESFNLLPIGVSVAPGGALNVARAGSVVFASGVFLALPLLVTLLITNIALGVLGRVAPQLNLIAIGFPITIVLGFVALLVGMSYLGVPLQHLFEYGLRSMGGVLAAR